MNHSSTVLPNQYGGFYELGTSFTDSRWSSIMKTYSTICQNSGNCSVHTLAKEAKCSKASAQVIVLCRRGMSAMPKKKRGHNKLGIGTLTDLKICAIFPLWYFMHVSTIFQNTLTSTIESLIKISLV